MADSVRQKRRSAWIRCAAYDSRLRPILLPEVAGVHDAGRRTMAAPLSPGLQRLLREPSYGEIATVMPDGSPSIAQVWVDTDGEHILINTAEGRQKTRNVRRDPRVAVNVVDPANA